jgi:Ca2+-binding EF-hand superfamily protein
MTIEKKKLKDLFQHQNNISFDEFCCIIENFSPKSDDAYFQETFHAFDKNSDGFITAKEIKRTMKELGERLTDRQAKDMLKTADLNGDRKLSKDEFRILFNYLNQFTTSSSSSSMTINQHNSQSIQQL